MRLPLPPPGSPPGSTRRPAAARWRRRLGGAAVAAATGLWPLVPVPEVVAPFDPPERPWSAAHRGVDLAGTPGQPVRVALPGRVAFVGRVAGRGVVSVEHGSTRTTYEPVAGDVAVGTVVAAGAIIGTLEAAGSHCAPLSCLHWGWRRGETYLDPLLLVGASGPVRLLPLTGLDDDLRPGGAPDGRRGAAGRW